jgi:hypothetical protein
MPGLGQGFKGYNRLTLLAILVKIWNTRHTPLGETESDLKIFRAGLSSICGILRFGASNFAYIIINTRPIAALFMIYDPFFGLQQPSPKEANL